jgi:hypothetical protein
MKEFKIAVCLFGQIRTGLYCAPAIKSAYDQLNGKEIEILFNKEYRMKCRIQVDYFCWTKNYDSAGYIKGFQWNDDVPFNQSVISDVFSFYQPIRSGVTPKESEPPENEDILADTIKWWAPKPLLLSIISSLRLKQEYEADCGLRYDLCVCQRFDALTTPFNPLEKLINDFGFQNNAIYTHWISQFPREDNCWGVGDFWFAGDSFAIDLMSASLGQYLIDVRRADYDINESQRSFGPNVLLYRACSKNNIRVIELPWLEAAPVRPTADLTLDVMALDTAHIHHNFFVKNHPGNL